MSDSTPENIAGGKPADEGDFILRRRYRVVEKLAPFRGKVCLDFGCGNGSQTRFFAPNFPLTIGVDVSAESLGEFAKILAKPGQVVAGIHYDGHRIPVADDSVDYIVSFEVLEHVMDEEGALRELARILRPGGCLAMSVPNRWWIFETHGAELPLLPWNRVPFFSWLPKKIHDRWARARIYRRREIVGRLREHGFVIRESGYITAPMDVLRWRSLQNVLRSTLFRSDMTGNPGLATAILVIAERPVA